MTDWRATRLTAALGVRLPLVAAPMAGGPTTPDLVAAVAGAGALGVLAGAYVTPGALREQVRAVRARTAAPFGVNLLLTEPVEVDEDALRAAAEVLAPWAAEVGLEPPTVAPGAGAEPLDEQVAVLVEERVALVSVAFGLPGPGVVAALHEAGALVAGTATTPAEARALAGAGVDLVVAQGAEAGGHRGTFLGDPADVPPLADLVPAVRRAVDLPVVAAGGVMDGAGVAAALALGADAVQLGTAFLLCPEAGTSRPWRDAVAAAEGDDTVVTRAFSGRPARGLRNRMSEGLAGATLPPYPVTNALTRPLRRRAAERGRADLLSLWAGTGVAAARALPAADLVAVLERETDAAVRAAGRG